MTDDHHFKLGPTTFFKVPPSVTPSLCAVTSFQSVLFQFLRQLFLAMFVFGLMVVGMYLTDSLPSQHPHYASSGNDASISPAFMTNDPGIHAQLNGRHLHPEL